MKFEEYLREVHAAQYIGTDDNMGDDFERWLEDLDKAELMEAAEEVIEKNAK